jgi:7-cyano-7-deazaguanine synthase in queuosine biosynthesis
MVTKTLVGFSGGVESTSLMKYLLLETDDLLQVVHIYCNDSRNRAQWEWAAVQRLLPELRKIRDFEFSRVDVSFPMDLWDPEVQCTVLPGLMRGYECHRFMRGLNIEDIYPSGRHENRDRLVQWTNFWLKWPLDSNISPDLPMFYWPKKQHMDYISEYLPLTFSCLYPKHDGSACMKCRTCLLREY